MPPRKKVRKEVIRDNAVVPAGELSPAEESRIANIEQIRERQAAATSPQVTLERARASAQRAGLSEFPQLINGEVATRQEIIERNRALDIRFEKERLQRIAGIQARATGLDIPVDQQVVQTFSPEMQTDITEQERLDPERFRNMSLGQTVRTLAEEAPPAFETITGAVRQAFNTAAQAYDVIHSSLLNKKPTTVQTYETAFNDASNIISKDIELVRAGIKNPVEAQRDFERAVLAINRLEETSHTNGMLNLRYWITDGFELETSIAQEKALLETQRLALLQAYIQSQNPTPIQENVQAVTQ